MVMDIFPEKRQYIAKGTYTLKNLTNKVIRQIHIQHNRFLSQHLALSQVKFSQEATLSQSFAGLYYSIYTLKKPLQPNEQLHMSFVTSFKPKGFVEKPDEVYHTVVKNGTFVDNGHFPMLGYSDMLELVNAKIRKKYGLPTQPNKTHTTHQHSIMGDDAYKVNLDVTLSTSGDQTAIAPGYLQKH
jgi:ABC-2 type transport system permease protein